MKNQIELIKKTQLNLQCNKWDYYSDDAGLTFSSSVDLCLKQEQVRKEERAVRVFFSYKNEKNAVVQVSVQIVFSQQSKTKMKTKK